MSYRRPIVLGLAAVLLGAGLQGYRVTHRDDTVILSRPGVATAGTLPTAPKLDGAVLPDIPVQDFSGAKRSFADLLGKPALINVWQESCLPCKDEMPALETVHRAVGDRVRFVGLDTQDSIERSRAFATKTGVTYELWRDQEGQLMSALKVALLPTTLLVNAAGKIVWSHAGPLTGPQLTAKLNEMFPA